MVLVDTSVWVEHLRRANAGLGALNRAEVLSLLGTLPEARAAAHEETFRFAEMHRLAGSGLGWIDMHLLAAAALSRAALWTLDRRLREKALQLGVASSS